MTLVFSACLVFNGMGALYMGQSVKAPFKEIIITMFHVLFDYKKNGTVVYHVLLTKTDAANEASDRHVLSSFSSSLIQGGRPRDPRSIRISEDDNSITYYDLLRGRDGLPGRDGIIGEKGESGMAGAAGEPGPPGPASGGVLYTRWGKSSCPDIAGTELQYSGRAAGTVYNQEGGGANYLCMPEYPEYHTSLQYKSGAQQLATVHGAEYQGPLQGDNDHNVPCAVCYVATREVVMMIPAKATCPPSWTREYYGYLMTEYRGVSNNIRGRTMFECVDKDQESLPGSSVNTNGVLFYHVEASCNGLPCPTYNNWQELNCVVCTK